LRAGNATVVEAPCAGTIVHLHVRSAGAVVHQGDRLAEMLCDGVALQAELTLQERGVALVRPGQSVKLLYNAFPFERYGVRAGTLRWLSPSSSGDDRGSVFRGLVDIGADGLGGPDADRPIRPGMTGQARVIVGRRSLASYALEPLRQLGASVARGPRGS
jgi:multidrug efflux pump subunit AcrA (membrane-fusion protein)